MLPPCDSHWCPCLSHSARLPKSCNMDTSHGGVHMSTTSTMAPPHLSGSPCALAPPPKQPSTQMGVCTVAGTGHPAHGQCQPSNIQPCRHHQRPPPHMQHHTPPWRAHGGLGAQLMSCGPLGQPISPPLLTHCSCSKAGHAQPPTKGQAGSSSCPHPTHPTSHT